MSDQAYLNFPVTILQGAFKEIRMTMSNIADYAGYVHTLTLDHGTDTKKMEDAGHFLDIKFYNPDYAYRNGRNVYNLHPSNIPKVGISSKMLIDFYNNPKTEYEIAVLLAYLALKSIIGNKPYIKTTNEFMIARMAGYSSVKDIPDPLPEALRRYTTRRMLDKIKFELQISWNVNLYGLYVRGFYVSFDNKFNLDKLAFEAEKRRKSTNEKQRKQAIQEARIKALTALNIN